MIGHIDTVFEPVVAPLPDRVVPRVRARRLGHEGAVSSPGSSRSSPPEARYWRFREAHLRIPRVRSRCPRGTSRYLTHIKRLKDAEDGVKLFWDRATGLGDKLGPCCSNSRLSSPPMSPGFASSCPGYRQRCERPSSSATRRGPGTRCSRCWTGPAAFVLADRPGFRGPYIRFHQGTRDGPGYRRDKLRRWADRIAAVPGRDVWAFFNNDHGGAAVQDAFLLRDLLERNQAGVA